MGLVRFTCRGWWRLIRRRRRLQLSWIQAGKGTHAVRWTRRRCRRRTSTWMVVLPPATVAHTVTAAGMSTPFIATPAPVVEQPGVHAKGFPTLRLLESPELLPSFGLSSPSPSPTLLSPPFSPNRVQAGPSQDAPDEDSLFTVSPLSPGLFFRPPRGSGSPPAGGVLLPTKLDDFDDLVLGDPITYARCEQFPGSESPLSLPVYAWLSGSAFLLDSAICQTVLAPGSSACRRRGPRPLPLL